MILRREHWRIAMIGVFGSVMAFGVFGGFSRLAKSGPRDPFDAIPKASFMAATIDFAELRRSPLYDVLLGKEALGVASVGLGMGPLQSACGFDPTTRIQTLAFSVPEEGDRGEFGVAARVEVTPDELETCTKALSEKRGGRLETHHVGPFVVLDDKSIRGALSPRLAYGSGGLLVIGKAAWFDAMLGAAEHKMPGIRNAKEHMDLRMSLTSREGFRRPTLLVTTLLPRSLRERLKGEMGAELGSKDLSNQLMAGVLDVTAVGIAMHAGGAGENVDVSAELVCDSSAASEAVERLLERKRTEWSGELSLRVIGLGPLLDSIKIERKGKLVRVTGTAQADALAETVDRLRRFRAHRDATEPNPQSVLGPRPADERIPARPDAGVLH